MSVPVDWVAVIGVIGVIDSSTPPYPNIFGMRDTRQRRRQTDMNDADTNDADTGADTSDAGDSGREHAGPDDAESNDQGDDGHGHDHDHESVDPVTDRVHDTSWSANLEHPRHAEDRALVVAQAIEAIEHTAPGNHVNLVTHGEHGHPETYLFGALEDVLDARVEYEYVDQCGCGGHVTRVEVN